MKGVIPKDIKDAVKNVFWKILKEQEIPQDQWTEKLMEVTKRHQELLDKWQTFESVDPQVDKLRDQIHAAILIGDYDKADCLFEKAVEIDDKAIAAQQENLDKRKLSKSQSLAAQADLAKTKLNFNKAIKLYKQALDVLPASHQTTQAEYLNNLGFLYYTTADYTQAEPLYERALQINETSFGKDHPNVARDLNNLAALYKATNRFTEAEPLMKRSLKIVVDFTRQTGHRHPHLIDAANNYIGLLIEMGDSREQAIAKVFAMASDVFGQKEIKIMQANPKPKAKRKRHPIKKRKHKPKK